jgi:hypothetical protein
MVQSCTSFEQCRRSFNIISHDPYVTALYVSYFISRCAPAVFGRIKVTLCASPLLNLPPLLGFVQWFCYVFRGLRPANTRPSSCQSPSPSPAMSALVRVLTCWETGVFSRVCTQPPMCHACTVLIFSSLFSPEPPLALHVISWTGTPSPEPHARLSFPNHAFVPLSCTPTESPQNASCMFNLIARLPRALRVRLLSRSRVR